MPGQTPNRPETLRSVPCCNKLTGPSRAILDAYTLPPAGYHRRMSLEPAPPKAPTLVLPPERAYDIARGFDLRSLSPDFYVDPYPYYHALRQHAPIKAMPDGSWLLTRYDDILPVY